MKKFLLAAILAVLPTVSFAASLQQYQPGFRLIDGTQLNKMVNVVNNLTGNGTPQAISASTLTWTSSAIGTSANANCLTVGRVGSTNPVLNIDCSTTTVATGLKVTGAAAASGLALAVISSGTNENLTLDAKGSGTITLAGTSTGNIVLTRATTGLSFSGTGLLTARSGTATPAAASAVAALSMGTAGVGIYWGTGSPNTALTAAKGSLFISTDGSSSSTRIFINTDGSTAWAAVTTAS